MATSSLKQTQLWRLLSQIRNNALSTLFPKYNTQRLYKTAFGKKIDLKHPLEINEKIHWLKLNTYYRNDVITQCVDKYEVREYIKGKGMEDLLPKLYGVYYKAEEIEWQSLPKQFVIKCNHGCGYNILCPDKDRLNRDNAIEKLNKWLKMDYWKTYCEVQYKYVKKKIIVEEYLGDNLATYKFFCFYGTPKLTYVLSQDDHNEEEHYLDYFDMDWNRLPYQFIGLEHYPGEIIKPESFEKMKEIAKKLSSDFPFVRVDLYNVQGKIYFSELTFVPTGGFIKLEPEETGIILGSWLELPMYFRG